MKAAELLAALEGFGLSDAESKALYHLGRLGEATATELAKETGLSRAEVYRTMDALEARGLIERTIERPQKFLPRPIEEALDRLVAAERQRVARLNDAKAQLLENWPSGTATAESDEDRFQVQRGRAQIDGSLSRMLEKAEREIALAAPHRTVSRLVARGIGDAVRAATARGVQVRILTQLTKELLEPDALPAGVEARHSDVPLYAQFLIVDQREIAVWVTADPVVGATGRSETVLWINAVDFILGQQTLFDELWIQAADPEARRQELATGRRPRDARLIKGRAARLDEMRDLVSRATREIRLALAAGDEGTVADRLGPALARAEKRGVRVHVVALGSLAGLPGSITSERRDPGPFTQLLVDDAELLIAVMQTEHAGRDGARDWAVVTSVPEAIAAAKTVFRATAAR